MRAGGCAGMGRDVPRYARGRRVGQAARRSFMVPPASGPCARLRSNWFRNLQGTQAFGRFDPTPTACETSLQGMTVTAADYSLQLGATVSRALTQPDL